MSRRFVGVVASVLALASASAHASAAEVWPSRAKRLEDGRLEYTYDLRPVKSGQVAVDLGPQADDAALAAFRKALPNETKVVVGLGNAQVRLHASGGVENAPLLPSFSRVPNGPFTLGAWDTRPRATNVPALHADAPKLLPSVDVLLWRQRMIEDAVEAGLLRTLQQGGAGLPQGRAAVFQRVLSAAVARYKDSSGNARDGAKKLAARIAGVMLATTGRMPDAVRGDSELMQAASEESGRITTPHPRFPPRPMYTWSRELADAHVWDTALAEPFGRDREGIAAALTLLAILEKDPALSKSYEALRAYRDVFLGKPAADGLETFRAKLGQDGAAGALEHMSEFFASLGPEFAESGTGAAPFALAQSPAQRFISQLRPQEQLHASEELTLAVQDGRVGFDANADAGWSTSRDAWTQKLLRPEANAAGRLVATGEYRDRLVRTFQALYGLHGDAPGGESQIAVSRDDGESPRIRLMVPPLLELEPLADTYADAAAAWHRLAMALAQVAKAANVRGVNPDGSVRAALAKEAAQQEELYRGLSIAARLSLGGRRAPLSDSERASLKVAQKFLAQWRSDPELRHDVRYLLPVGRDLDEGSFVHSGVFGIGRREIEATFEGAPEITLLASGPEPSLFEADATAVQRYQIPVLVTGAVTVSRAAPMDPAEFRAFCDRNGNVREAIEAELPGALVRTMKQVSADPE